MGREADCGCRWGTQAGQVTALLESTELLLRGDIRRRVPLANLRNVQARPDGLHLVVGTEQVALTLNAADAAAWAKEIATPPPTLRQKLGLTSGATAFVIGLVDTPELAAALHETTAATPSQANMLIAIVANEAELQSALGVHPDLPPGAPIWVVHGKGRAAPFGETLVRSQMRAVGFIDTKVAAVSATLTATCYAPIRSPSSKMRAGPTRHATGDTN